MSEKKSVIVQAPASTSNCGPGFDTLGLALSLYNFIRVTTRGDGEVHDLASGGEATRQMVLRTSEAFFEAAGIGVGGFDFEIWGEVPPARGLGSSSTVRAGILAGLNSLHGEPLDREQMIRLTAGLDNAPDNACAVFAGGFCIARTNPADFSYREHVRFDLGEDLAFVAVSPGYEVLTEQARRVLPDTIPFQDVVRSANSLAFLVGALVSGDYDRLRGAVNDYIHQPYRQTLNPFASESIAAGCAAGAFTGWLSGSGSTVVCVARKTDALDVGKAMLAVYEANATDARVFRLAAENKGLRVSNVIEGA